MIGLSLQQKLNPRKSDEINPKTTFSHPNYPKCVKSEIANLKKIDDFVGLTKPIILVEC